MLADLYATLISNPARWRNTMLVVTYDEHGGFYDHVPPLSLAATVGGMQIATTGVRVPAFLVSPHVAPGVPFTDAVDHTSFLQLLADRFSPGQPYSTEVADRQRNLGSLATALTQIPSAPVAGPFMPNAVSAHLSAASAAPPGAAPVSAGAAKTAEAFHTAAMKLAADHPELLSGPGWQQLARYLSERGEKFGR